MIYLILGNDVLGQDKYQRANLYFNQWINEDILIRDGREAIYFYLQQYNIKGEKKTRLGFIALLRLDEKRSSIFPHEQTRIEPKEDRLRLLGAVKANLSPIFVLFSDEKRIIQRTYEQSILKEKPFIEVVDDEKTLHQMWKVTDPEILEMFQVQLSNKNIFIADGHHRYEVSLMYREQIRKELGDSAAEGDFNYVMTYFTNVESKGLTILPVHRLVNGVDMSIPQLKEKLQEFFDVEEMEERVRFFFLMAKSGSRQPTLGLYKDRKFFLLRLKNIRILDKIIINKPKEYGRLDVSILNHLVFNRVLGIEPDSKDMVIYNQNADELIISVDAKRDSLAFFLNPVKVEQMLSVAAKGERLPPKTTYFYPKVLSGLAINKFNDGKT
jgi:uncharacterized protein (DUF1015 family)